MTPTPRRILLTLVDRPQNAALAERLHGRGHTVLGTAGGPMSPGALPPPYAVEVEPGDREARRVLYESISADVDVVIHGHEGADEHRELDDPETFAAAVQADLRRVFEVSRAAVPNLIRKRAGLLLFPLVFDPLHYDGYPVSPTRDHAKLSFMKCLARELSPFRISANALTLGYHAGHRPEALRKQVSEACTIYALKPALPKPEELWAAADLFIEHPNPAISGQNLCVGAGLETTF